MALENLPEPENELSAAARDMKRAVASLMEELQAAAWYDMRVETSKDPRLKAVLAHNRDEEKEHAAMLLEWIRRNDAVQAKALKDYLFTEGSITSLEEKNK
jgi:ferritin-like protein